MQSKTSAAFLLIGTFLLGGVTGAVSISLYRTHTGVAAAPEAGKPPRKHRDLVEDLARDLNMEAEQKEKLRVILARTGEHFRKIHEAVGPQFQTAREQGRQEIRKILREDQKARFEEIMREIDARRRRFDKPPR